MTSGLRVLQIHPPVGHGVDVYRVENLAEQIERAGHETEIFTVGELGAAGSAAELVADRDLVVLHRVAWDARIEAIVEAARGRRATTVFEADDLVFVPGTERWVDGVRRLPAEQVELYAEGLERYAATYRACDAFLASTPFLGELRPFGPKRSGVIRNVLGSRQLEVARRIRRATASRESREEGPVIGFGAGTATHDRDIEAVVPALLELLEEHPSLRVEVVGPVDLGETFRAFPGRVRQRDARPWEEWWELLAGFDVALAPLERTNPYCRAKSALKFLEAAILDVPVVASRIDDYEHEIEEGRTGFLAADSGEWYQAIESLLEDDALRARVARDARRHVEEQCTAEVRAEESVAQLHALHEGRQPPPQHTPRLFDLSWLIPSPFPGSGGHANIFAAARALERRGHRCTFHVDTSQLAAEDGDGIREFVERHFGETPVRFEPGWELSTRHADLAVATSWATAETVARSDASAKSYFVQDFENLFFPPGEDAVRAERTYHLGLSCVTLGGWLTHELRERYAADSCAFSFPVTVEGEPERTARDGSRRLLFFAQPGKPRRGYRLGLEALERFHAACPDVKIAFFGSKDVDPGEVPVPFEDHGILSEGQLAELYCGADAAFVISMTNPTLVSPNMMRCGCVPVDLDLPNNAFEYRDGEDSLLAEPTPDGIAQALRRLFEDRALLERLRAGGAATSAGRSLEVSGDEIESAFVRKMLTGTAAERPLRLDAYQGDPGGWVSLAEGPVVQEIDARADGLSRLSLVFGTFETEPGDLRVELLDLGSGESRADLLVPGDTIPNNEWCPVDFEPIEESAGRRLAVRLWMADPDANPLAVYWSALGAQVDGCACQDAESSIALPGPLCFQTWVRPEGAPMPERAGATHPVAPPLRSLSQPRRGISPAATRIVEVVRAQAERDRVRHAELSLRAETLERVSAASLGALDRMESRLGRLPVEGLLRRLGLSAPRETFLEPMRFVTAEIRGATTMAQCFVAEHAALDQVLVRIATEGQRLVSPVVLRLREGGPRGRVVREAEIAADRAYDNQLCAAAFDPIEDSKGQRYCFELSSEEAMRGCAPRVWGQKTRGPRGHRRYHRGRTAPGRLEFLASYAQRQQGEDT